MIIVVVAVVAVAVVVLKVNMFVNVMQYGKRHSTHRMSQVNTLQVIKSQSNTMQLITHQ